MMWRAQGGVARAEEAPGPTGPPRAAAATAPPLPAHSGATAGAEARTGRRSLGQGNPATTPAAGVPTGGVPPPSPFTRPCAPTSLIRTCASFMRKAW